MDISDTEEPNNDVDDVAAQDLFDDEADENRLSAEEDNVKEKPLEEKAKEKLVQQKPKIKKEKNERLLSYKALIKPSGLSALKKMFTDFKFKGNGHEEEDLTKIMGILQHWMCYQLCPSYDFESAMLRLEYLGKKRIVQTFMKKFRLGIEDWGEINPNNDDEEEKNENMESCEPSTENDFDKFLNEELANIGSLGELSSEDEDFDVQQKTQIETEILPTPEHMDTQQRIQNEVEVSLTPEQLERIAMNKKLAEERRKKRMSQQGAKSNEEPASVNDSDIIAMEVDVNT